MTGAAPAPPAARGGLRGMIAAIAAISIFAFGLSLSIPLFSILLEEMGVSGVMIGLNGAAAAAAILAGGTLVPLALRHVSLGALMIGATVAMAALLLVFPLYPNPWFWMGLRFLFGFTTATLFVCSEIWIISAAPPKRRGLVIGIYGLFLSIGFLVGPLVLKMIGAAGWAPFLTGAAISLCAIPPVLAAWREQPDLSDETEGAASFADVFRFFRTDPAILWAVTLFGVIEFGAMGLFPVWSIRLGADAAAALTLVALLAAGNVILQVPFGWLGDKADRRRLLGVCAFASVMAAMLFPALAHTVWPLWLVTLLWGGLVVGLYTFSLNELGSRYIGAKLARGTGAFTTAYGFGALVAPPALGAALDAWPPHGMFYVLAAAAGAYVAMLILKPRRIPASGWSETGLDSDGTRCR
ncbi:MAG: MFS transporter [Paracoccaceae bacterium]